MAKKYSVAPIDIESPYGLNEMFFSTTDEVGNILTGNDVFVRVSQYTREELMGSPHNIIRHPDMPKVVFKLLWDYIKAGKFICAYVKNMSKEGKYYWVLASVFPIPGGYLSIRIKPSSSIFQLIPEVYKGMLTVEEANGMQAAAEHLLGVLKSKGFESYDSFMTAVLMAELHSRQEKMSSQGSLHTIASSSKIAADSNIPPELHSKIMNTLSDVSNHCNKINGIFIQLFSDFEMLLKVTEVTNVTTSLILKFSEKISILSLNSSIETHRLGEQGLTLSVIAKAIKSSSGEIEQLTSFIVNRSKDISSHSQELGLLTATSRLQSDMVSFFGMELLEKVRSNNLRVEDIKVITSNIQLLINNFDKTFSQFSEILNPLSGKIAEILKSVEVINKITRNLERSDVLGSIESSVIGEQGIKFSIVFNEMRTSTEATRQKLLEFEKYLNRVIAITQNINQSNKDIFGSVSSIDQSIAQLV